MPGQVKSLDTQLMEHLKSIGAKIPKPNPEYRGK
jgi:hypothetical protein